MEHLSANLDTADKSRQSNKDSNNKKEVSRKEEWEQVEYLVLEYQKQFDEDADEEQIQKSNEAGIELIERFQPFLKKYAILFKSGQIDFNDKEMKLFVASFMDEDDLKRALKRKKQKKEYRARIYEKFNFIKETYGSLPEDEILTDLQMLLLQLAKRYKQMGKNFAAYLYNSFRYEVARHIKKFIRNPLNIPYRKIKFEDYMSYYHDPAIENDFEDKFYEDSLGIPDMSWIQGETCSELFGILSPLERKLIVKYYLEHWNDRQISEEFGIHINTVNQKRRMAIRKLAKELGIDEKDIKRSRRSGKKAIMPIKFE